MGEDNSWARPVRDCSAMTALPAIATAVVGAAILIVVVTRAARAGAAAVMSTGDDEG